MMRSQRGFSMVELMVGVLIGLIGIVVISQMYAVSEDRKRSATGASDAQVAGNIAIFSMERGLRMAGYGLSSGMLVNCTTLAYNSTMPTPDFSFVIRPVWIEQGTSDAITVMYSGSAGVAALEGNDFNGGVASGADFPLGSVAGFGVKDLVIAAEAGKDCSLAEITDIPSGTNTLQHNGSIWNKAGGLGVAYTADGALFNVGLRENDSANPHRTPFTVQRFRVVNDVLRMESRIPYVASADTDADGYSDYPLATGVVQMQAMYGMDDGVDDPSDSITNTVYAADDGVVDRLITTVPADLTAWRRALIVRVAMLVRVGKFERTQVTTAAPTWSEGAFTMANLADGTDWRNYRYRVYEVDIPLRNVIWRPS